MGVKSGANYRECAAAAAVSRQGRKVDWKDMQKPRNPLRFPWLTLAASLCVLASASAQSQPARGLCRTTILASGLSDPTQMAFRPDGRIYILSKEGAIHLLDPKTGQTTPAGTLPASNVREDGLHSLVLDPAFQTNQRVFILFGTLTPAPSIVVARFAALAAGAIDVASRKDLLSVPYSLGAADEHNTGCLAFGPDGNLYIGLADNTKNIFSGTGTGYAPRDPTRPDYDAQRSAANSNDLRRKILRIHPEEDGTYTVPAGNLFAPGTAKTRPEIFAMGLRHPFRITVDAKTGWLFWAEPGPNAMADKADMGPRGYDEVNLAKDAGYYGWPYCVGNNFCYPALDYATGNAGATYDPAALSNTSANNTGIAKLPAARPALIWYPYNSTGSAFPIFGSGSTNTSMLGPVYRFDATLASPNKLPRYFDGHLFIFDFSRSLIHAVQVDDAGKLVEVKRFWDQTTTNPIANPIDAKIGPDGALYFLGWGDNGAYPHNAGHGNLVKLDYTGPADPVGVAVGPRAHRADWSMLAPRSTWKPAAACRSAEAFDPQGRKIWSWVKAGRLPQGHPGVLRVRAIGAGAGV